MSSLEHPLVVVLVAILLISVGFGFGSIVQQANPTTLHLAIDPTKLLSPTIAPYIDFTEPGIVKVRQKGKMYKVFCVDISGVTVQPNYSNPDCWPEAKKSQIQPWMGRGKK